MESEVSLQLQRFFSDCMNLFEGIRMRSVVVSCWDEQVKEAFEQASRDLEKSWRSGTAFRL
jgi:chloramphenicol 3-O-phosphotransferase